MKETDRQQTGEQRGNGVIPLRPRAIIPIIRAAGLIQWSVVFVLLFCVVSAVVAMAEPTIDSFGDAAWVMFQAVTTIGFGDYSCVTAAGRLAIVVLSCYSVFYLALLTGAVVTYCTERMNASRDESVAHFIDQLEHLPELRHDELVRLSSKVKEIRKRANRS
ncbi:MAG: potassium channel family protein [Coriobacteriales bacterium]|nr:potassium channel family protein [Coriobacteriales bacterium]